MLISVEDYSSFPNLMKAPFEIRKRRPHYDALPDLAELGTAAYNCYLKNMFTEGGPEDPPLVTVFTPAYRTGERIRRPFLSLTYTNWEWVVVDDSDDSGKTFQFLTAPAKEDHWVQVFKPWELSEVIGRVKNWAGSLGKGRILVELDHDGELTDHALEWVVTAFRQFPEAGFLYSDCAEIF